MDFINKPRPEIKSLHIELSSFCNAFCLGCARTSDMSSKVDDPIEPSHLKPDAIRSLLSSSTLDYLDNVFLCGVMGDPLASPYLKQFCENLKEIKPKVWSVIHTNGSLGSQSLWRWLGHFSEDSQLEVVFSIDGLEETNEQYRIGVEWEKVLSNMRTFIDSGGNATWKFIIFPHNEHQVEEARSLAAQLGCNKFQTRKNYDSDRVPGKKSLEQVQLSKASLSSSSGMSRVEMEAWVKESYDGVKTIHCKSEADQQLYIDSWGNVWPCCWTGNLGLKRASFMDREIFHKLVLNEYEKEFNNLNIKSLDEILEHSFFKHDLKDTWFRHNSGVGNCDSPACLKHCGKAD